MVPFERTKAFGAWRTEGRQIVRKRINKGEKVVGGHGENYARIVSVRLLGCCTVSLLIRS